MQEKLQCCLMLSILFCMLLLLISVSMFISVSVAVIWAPLSHIFLIETVPAVPKLGHCKGIYNGINGVLYFNTFFAFFRLIVFMQAHKEKSMFSLFRAELYQVLSGSSGGEQGCSSSGNWLITLWQHQSYIRLHQTFDTAPSQLMHLGEQVKHMFPFTMDKS